ncbi:MAG: hypothetical protein ABR592_01085 [Nitriliruptorales bacterium]
MSLTGLSGEERARDLPPLRRLATRRSALVRQLRKVGHAAV